MKSETAYTAGILRVPNLVPAEWPVKDWDAASRFLTTPQKYWKTPLEFSDIFTISAHGSVVAYSYFPAEGKAAKAVSLSIPLLEWFSRQASHSPVHRVKDKIQLRLYGTAWNTFWFSYNYMPMMLNMVAQAGVSRPKLQLIVCNTINHLFGVPMVKSTPSGIQITKTQKEYGLSQTYADICLYATSMARYPVYECMDRALFIYENLLQHYDDAAICESFRAVVPFGKMMPLIERGRA